MIRRPRPLLKIKSVGGADQFLFGLVSNLHDLIDRCKALVTEINAIPGVEATFEVHLDIGFTDAACSQAAPSPNQITGDEQ